MRVGNHVENTALKVSFLILTLSRVTIQGLFPECGGSLGVSVHSILCSLENIC